MKEQSDYSSSKYVGNSPIKWAINLKHLVALKINKTTPCGGL